MNVGKTIILIFTIIFIILSLFFLIFQYIEIPNNQNAKIDEVLEKISTDLNV